MELVLRFYDYFITLKSTRKRQNDHFTILQLFIALTPGDGSMKIMQTTMSRATRIRFVSNDRRADVLSVRFFTKSGLFSGWNFSGVGEPNPNASEREVSGNISCWFWIWTVQLVVCCSCFCCSCCCCCCWCCCFCCCCCWCWSKIETILVFENGQWPAVNVVKLLGCVKNEASFVTGPHFNNCHIILLRFAILNSEPPLDATIKHNPIENI